MIFSPDSLVIVADKKLKNQLSYDHQSMPHHYNHNDGRFLTSLTKLYKKIASS